MNNDNKERMDSFLNKTSLWIWFYVGVLFVFSLYPLFNIISYQICYGMISTKFAQGLTEHFQVVTLVIASYLIYPIGLLIIDLIPLFFLKTKENKKLYLILSLIFLISFLISFIICLFKFVIIPLK